MKSLFKRPSARQLIIVGVSIPILLLVLVGWLQWQSVSDYTNAREWGTHTRIVMLNLESLLSCLNDAETGQRGYLLTHKEAYLEPYTHALRGIPHEMQALRYTTQGNLEEQKNINQLEPLVDAKLNELAQTVALERNLDHAGAIKVVMNDFGKNTMNQIRVILTSMQDIERGLLQEREESYQRLARRNSMLSGMIIAIGIGFIIAVFFLLRRLERMQEMVKICAWSKLIEFEGEWLSIEDYLTRRFKAHISHGMSDDEAKKMLRLINKEKQK